jgi:hypothetical protein
MDAAAGSVAAATTTMLSDTKTTSGCANKATFYTCCPAGRFVCTTGVSAHYAVFAAVAIATATVSLDSHSKKGAIVSSPGNRSGWAVRL